MARPITMRFELHELAAALFRFQGIHEGRWHLSVEVAVASAPQVGPDEQGVLPGVTVLIRGLRLKRWDDAPDGTPQVFDAAKENPAET
jgi:hypothetical protein